MGVQPLYQLGSARSRRDLMAELAITPTSPDSLPPVPATKPPCFLESYSTQRQHTGLDVPQALEALAGYLPNAVGALAGSEV